MTNAWFSKNLGDAMLAGDALSQLEELFLSAYGKHGIPETIALFIRHESEGHLHCEVKVYFSPAAVSVAKKVDADPCRRPSRNGLSLLIGSKDCWLALFPEHDESLHS